MDMDVHWKPFRVFNYLTDVCVNLILCYPNVTVKDNSKKKKYTVLAYWFSCECLLFFLDFEKEIRANGEVRRSGNQL